jgi:multidrug efflux pump subunit AcrA (membrane-fusion protein)
VLFESAAQPGVSPGALLRGRIATAGARRVLAVPASALVDEDGIPSLYLHVAGESFIKRWVRTGVRDGAWVEILDGLTGGERIVVEGAAVVRLVSLSGAISEHSH